MARNGIIIGGGAAGLMAAISAAEGGAQVTVLEHMPRVGKKILATGNGKCNLTNRYMDASCYRSGVPDFPMQVILRFPVDETLRFFRSIGIYPKEKDGYVYPASLQASAVLDALREKAAKSGVQTVCACHIDRLFKEDEQFVALTDQGRFTADFAILAAGSAAAPSTGSDGSGYALARSFGHHIKKPLPALVQLRCRADFLKSIAGVRTEATVRLFSGNEELSTDRGELQLTDYGISGIPVFQVSRYAALYLDQKREVTAVLDFFPSMNEAQFFELLMEQRAFLENWPSGEFLNGLFPKKLAALFLKQAKIDPAKTAAQISDKELTRLCGLIKDFRLSVTATNPFEQAQTCVGGVDVREVNADTMESRLTKGLYLAGEILDVDGICGGYNLQWAWSSGYLAGSSAAKKG